MEYITHSRAETVALGEKMAAVLPAGSLVAFTGGLGAGKTAFCEGLAKGLGCLDPVSSPTFAIMNEYRGEVPLFHFDLYRIGDPEELDGIGFEEFFEKPGVMLIEWSERVQQLLPPHTIVVTLQNPGYDDTRRITVEGGRPSC